MNNRRIVVLGSVLGLLCMVLLWNFIAGWGLVTVHVRKVPLSKIIASIESQSGAKIGTDADLSSPVSMDVDKVPAAMAVSVLADRIEGSWRLFYIVASSRTEILPAVDALKAGERRPKDWKMFSAGRQGFFGGMSDVVLDPRETLWKISDMPDKNVQAFLNQFAQKTGITALVPDAWNPSVSKALKEGKAHVAIPALAKAAGGASEEFFFIRKPGRNPDGERMAGGPPDAGDAGGGRPESNPEWAKERFEAQIAMLPASEQDAARAEREQMQKTFQSLRDLPADQRQAKMEQIMNDPANSARIEDRMAAAQDRQNSNRSPEQRANRYRAYVARKQAAKQAALPAKP